MVRGCGQRPDPQRYSLERIFPARPHPESDLKHLGGEPYPAPPAAVTIHTIDPVAAASYGEADLERIFTRVETQSMETMINTGQWSVDAGSGLIRNDTAWKGFFPRGHILNQI